MQFKAQPQDFVVEELLKLPLTSEGAFSIYRIEKQNITTLQVQTHIANQLRRRPADIQTPALKDKKATAIQHLGLRGVGPAEIEGPGYRARCVGRSQRPLRPSDLKGNRFTITLRDLSLDEADRICTQLKETARFGLPNYFDEQRFGSFCTHPDAPDHFIGKTILRRDAEQAVRAYLAYPFRGDPSAVRSFKAVARRHWGEWIYLLERAPRPSNYRSLLTFLKDHPRDYRKTLNLVPQRILSLYLVAYQSYLWNQIAGGYLACLLASVTTVRTLRILDLVLPLYRELPAALHAKVSGTSVPLPNHRATYTDSALLQAVNDVLEAEGLQINDLKARILKRAYLPKGGRALLLHPTDIACDPVKEDDQFAGRQKMGISFSLPRGAFATLVLKRLGLDDHQSLQ